MKNNSLFVALISSTLLFTGCERYHQLIGDVRDDHGTPAATGGSTPSQPNVNPDQPPADTSIQGEIHLRHGDAFEIPRQLSFEATITVMNQSNQKVADVKVGTDGKFRLFVKPGTYTLIPQPPIPNPNSLKAEPERQSVTVESQEIKSVIIVYGTGGMNLPDTGVEGEIHILRGDAIERPTQLPFAITIAVMKNGQKVTDIEMGTAATFQVALEPGTYSLIPQQPVPNPDLLQADSQTIVVESQQFTFATVLYRNPNGCGNALDCH